MTVLDYKYINDRRAVVQLTAEDLKELVELLVAQKVERLRTDEPDVLSVAEYASRMKKHQDTIRRQCRKGVLKCQKIGHEYYIENPAKRLAV